MTAPLYRAIADTLKKKTERISSGLHLFNHRVTLQIKGSAVKREDEDYTPTSSLPLLDILAIFAKKAGVQGPRTLELIREAALEALENGEKPKDYLECTKEALRQVRERVTSRLPKETRAGAFIRAVELEILSVEPIPA